MRISFSGAANTGKSTLIDTFIRKWPMYTRPGKTYRDVITENGLDHSSKTSDETQLIILDWMMKEQKNYPKGSKVIYDRCPWDNLVYTLQGNARNIISDEVTAASISFVKEAMKDIDIIFWLPYSDHIKVVNDGMRDVDLEYIKETDKIFEDLFDQYSDDLEKDLFYPKEDAPAIIKMEGLSVDDRIFYISQFIDPYGNLIVDESSILDPNNVELLETILKEQTLQKGEEEKLKELIKSIKG